MQMTLFAICIKPGPTSGFATVPVIPTKLQQEALHQSHDQLSAGQQSAAQDIGSIAARGLLGWNGKGCPTLLSTMHNMSTS